MAGSHSVVVARRAVYETRQADHAEKNFQPLVSLFSFPLHPLRTPMGLAGIKQKQRISADPNNLTWSNGIYDTTIPTISFISLLIMNLGCRSVQVWFSHAHEDGLGTRQRSRCQRRRQSGTCQDPA